MNPQKPKSNRGGARPGAGRKPKREKYIGAVEQAERRIADRLPLLIDRMIELADGVSVEEVDKDGKRMVYLRPPDRQAAEYLINRVMGKPTERKEISGPDAGPLPIVFDHGVALADLAAGPDEDPDTPGADEGDRDGA